MGFSLEKAKEEKHENKLSNENFSSGGEQRNRRKRKSDESEEKLRTFAGMKEHERDNNEPNESIPNKKFICKVCGEKFCSIKAVHGHMRMHSGKKRVAEVTSDEGKEKGQFLVRSKTRTFLKFKPPQTPDSGTPQNPVLNNRVHGGEAWSFDPMKRERSSSERKIDVSGPGLFQSPANHSEHDSIAIYMAISLLMMHRGLRDGDLIPPTWSKH